MNAFVLALAIIVSYFVGTIPSAIVVARSKGIDITTFGSGNPGASNVGRALGFKYFIVVFVIDVAKGAVPTLLLLNNRPAAYLCGAAAILGHIFPVTRQLKGGKGVATGAGVLLPLFPIVMVICLGTWLTIMKVSKKAALASVIAVPLAIVLVSILGHHETWEVFAFLGIAALIEIRHISNIKRMLSGSENSLDVKK
jgi:glycerol-3-phosphate acyltransferase PlsY